MGHRAFEPVVATIDIPPGVIGPDAASFEVRSFVASGPDGLLLVDVGPPGNVDRISRAIEDIGAAWADVTDIVLTHRHFDHAGGLAEVTDRARRARVWSGAGDRSAIASESRLEVLTAVSGQLVGGLRVIETPGHTAGHLSLVDDDASLLLIGDLIGIHEGALTFGPPSSTADLDLNVRMLRRAIEIELDRVLFSHGAEMTGPAEAIRAFLDAAGPELPASSAPT